MATATDSPGVLNVQSVLAVPMRLRKVIAKVARCIPMLQGGVSLVRALERKRFRRFCLSLSNLTPEPIFVKVGANDGVTGDPCSGFLLDDTRWKGLLIEPVPYCFERLKRNFNDTKRFALAQVGVGTPPGQAAFYYVGQNARENLPSRGEWREQIGSFDKNHLMKLLNAEAKRFVVECTVEVSTLAAVLSRNGVPHFHLLQIDTEGHDYEVLKSMDFTRHLPTVIFVEYKHVPGPDKVAMRKLLRDRGYSVRNCGGDYFALHKEGYARLLREAGRSGASSVPQRWFPWSVKASNQDELRNLHETP